MTLAGFLATVKEIRMHSGGPLHVVLGPAGGVAAAGAMTSAVVQRNEPASPRGLRRATAAGVAIVGSPDAGLV